MRNGSLLDVLGAYQTVAYFAVLIVSAALYATAAAIDYRWRRDADARFALRCLTATLIVLILSLGSLGARLARGGP